MDSKSPIRSQVRAVLFDAYGTLFDVYSVIQAADELFPGRGDAVSQLWREKQIEYTRLVSMSGVYQPFEQLTRAALQWSAERLGLRLTAAAESALMSQYQRLMPFPENREVLTELRARSVRAGILSNGDPPMLAAAVDSAGFGSLLDPIISVQSTGRYKTDPVAYGLGPETLQLPAHEILFVSSNCWDAIGATWFGYHTLWINRSGVPVERLGITPHHTGASLHAVLDFFAANPGYRN